MAILLNDNKPTILNLFQRLEDESTSILKRDKKVVEKILNTIRIEMEEDFITYRSETNYGKWKFHSNEDVAAFFRIVIVEISYKTKIEMCIVARSIPTMDRNTNTRIHDGDFRFSIIASDDEKLYSLGKGFINANRIPKTLGDLDHTELNLILKTITKTIHDYYL